MLALDKVNNEALGRYLAARGVVDAGAALTVEPLGGGVSNIVLRVTTPEDESRGVKQPAVKRPARCLVLKQALPELRVEAYWPSRVDRALREADALRIAAEHLPDGAVPDVAFVDEENYIYGMSCAPPSATLWKEDLLGGVVETPVAAAAGRLLARLHAIQEPAARERFIDDEVFWQLRVDPYYNTTAEKNPSLQPVFAAAIAHMRARKTALAHGDYSPKNMFVLRGNDQGSAGPPSRTETATPDAGYKPALPEGKPALPEGKPALPEGRPALPEGKPALPEGRPALPEGRLALPEGKPALSEDEFALPEETACLPDGDGNCAQSVLLLDFEVVHWGDPAFDLAFCVNHLLIKSIVNAHVQPAYFQAVEALLAGYRETLPGVDWRELAGETRLQLGCLMLARIDGKSPVEYITDEPTKEMVRRVSRFILHEQPDTMNDIFARIAGETAP